MKAWVRIVSGNEVMSSSLGEVRVDARADGLPVLAQGVVLLVGRGVGDHRRGELEGDREAVLDSVEDAGADAGQDGGADGRRLDSQRSDDFLAEHVGLDLVPLV